MDENEQTREVYARYGLTMYMAQCVEIGLVNLLTFVYEAGPTKLTIKDVDKLFNELQNKTLGTLIKKLEKSTKVPKSLKRDLKFALKNRNWLAHQYFFDRAEHFFTSDGRSKMLKELDNIFTRLERLNSELEELMFSWAKKYGLSHEQIMKQGVEIIAKEDKLNVSVDKIIKSLNSDEG